VAARTLRLFSDYVYNWDAVNEDAHGYQVGMRLGQARTRGDVAFTALYHRIEQEAVISAFSWSDVGFGGTNVHGGVFALDYQPLDPLTLTARAYLTNLLRRASDQKNETTGRVQLDALVRC
jgi:hypothetical protein